jgi:hypothetical protein
MNSPHPTLADGLVDLEWTNAYGLHKGTRARRRQHTPTASGSPALETGDRRKLFSVERISRKITFFLETPVIHASS